MRTVFCCAIFTGQLRAFNMPKGKKNMKFPSQRFRIAACLGFGCALQSHAARSQHGETSWPPLARADILLGAALLLALISLLLLRRYQRLRGKPDAARRARGMPARMAWPPFSSGASLAALQDGIKESERRRIARDIHDDLGQNLLALKIDISMLQVSTSGMHPLVSEKLALIARNIDLSIKSMRCIINDLRPVGLEAGLQAAVERQLGEFGRINGLHCGLHVDAGVYAASAGKDVEAILFRILQEALSNIARHAAATEVDVALRRDASGLHMTVSDNGVGMPAPAVRGRGLLGMEERVAAAGGRLAIDSAAGSGTVIALTLPLAEARLA